MARLRDSLSSARRWALLFALVFLTGLILFRPEFVRTLDVQVSDAAWRLAARKLPREERIVVIDIDEASLAELGPWPWPRERLAALARTLWRHGAAMQVYDLLFDAPRPGDAEFAAALSEGPAVLANLFAIEQGAAIAVGRLGGAGALAACPPAAARARGWRAPAEPYAALLQGHINPRIDADGIVRALPAFVCVGERAWPALALAAWLAVTGAAASDAVPARLEAGRGLFAPAYWLAHPALPEPIALTADGALLIPYWLEREAILAVSAADLLAGRVPPERIAGRIALIGSSAFSLGDVVATPLAGAEAGVAVHHQMLAGLLDGRLPHGPRAERGIAFGAGLFSLLGLMILASRRYALILLPLAGLGLSLMLLAMQIALQSLGGLLIGLAAPAYSALLAGLMLGTAELLRHRREIERLFTHLSSYLPAPVAARLAVLRPGAEPMLEARELSVMHADLRNFSVWSEARPAQEVAAILDEFLRIANEVVESHGGLVEVIEGDAVLAVWNGSSPCPDHPARALAAARALYDRLVPRLPSPGDDPILPPLALGIGLESGLALIGSLGPARRRQHSVLGLPVTRAVRLQAMTADLAWPILVGPELARRHPDPGLIDQGEFLLEGLRQPCRIHADRRV